MVGKYNKSFQNISSWKIDKMTKKNKRVKKIEIYNYFYKKDLDKLLKFLNTKKFQYTKNSKLYPSLFNILLAREGKIVDGQEKIINNNHPPNYYYKIHFCRVLLHRKRPFLLKIYENIAQKKNFFKLEITYFYFPKKYFPCILDWLYSLKGINEIIGKIEQRFLPKGYSEDFSGNITFDKCINENIKLLNNSKKQQVLMEVYTKFII